MKDLCWFPVQAEGTVLYQKLHHFHHLLTAVANRLGNEMGTRVITAGKKKTPVPKTQAMKYDNCMMHLKMLTYHLSFVLCLPYSRVGSV